MIPLKRIVGPAIPFGRDNVDTDVILPGRYLKTLSRSGLGTVAFEGVRAEPGNVFDDPRYSAAPILVAGANFGCGSSREHAAWALIDRGIRVVVAVSFSDIFAGNAFRNGILTVAAPQEVVAILLRLPSTAEVTVDLLSALVIADGVRFPFIIEPFRRECLIRGLDEIALTLGQVADIVAFEGVNAVPPPGGTFRLSSTVQCLPSYPSM